MRSHGVQRITFHLLRLKSLQDLTDAADVTHDPTQHGGIGSISIAVTLFLECREPTSLIF